MRTDRIPVADRTELGVDLWLPAAGSAAATDGPSTFVVHFAPRACHASGRLASDRPATFVLVHGLDEATIGGSPS